MASRGLLSRTTFFGVAMCCCAVGLAYKLVFLAPFGDPWLRGLIDVAIVCLLIGAWIDRHRVRAVQRRANIAQSTGSAGGPSVT